MLKNRTFLSPLASQVFSGSFALQDPHFLRGFRDIHMISLSPYSVLYIS